MYNNVLQGEITENSKNPTVVILKDCCSKKIFWEDFRSQLKQSLQKIHQNVALLVFTATENGPTWSFIFYLLAIHKTELETLQ